MKKFFFICLLFVCSFAESASLYSYYQLKPGRYELRGGNSASNTPTYRGTVFIKPQGTNYNITWKIGKSQSQQGIGILQGNILSVAFLDQTSDQFGVVSFRQISDSQLEGRWTTFNSDSYAKEFLRWESSETH